jgi:hypothetical protein
MADFNPAFEYQISCLQNNNLFLSVKDHDEWPPQHQAVMYQHGQTWRIEEAQEPDANGYIYRLTSVQYNRVLTIGECVFHNGCIIHTEPQPPGSNPSPASFWRIKRWPNALSGYWWIETYLVDRNRPPRPRRLDMPINGNEAVNVQQWEQNDSDDQVWKIVHAVAVRAVRPRASAKEPRKQGSRRHANQA